MKQLFFMFVLFCFCLNLGLTHVFAGLSITPGDAGQTVGNGDAGQTVGHGDAGPVVQANPIVVPNPIKATSIEALFAAIIDILLVFAIPLIVFFIIYAGFLYVTARGNAEVIETAHKALLYALIGGVLILGAKVLISVISGTVESFRTASLIISPFIG